MREIRDPYLAPMGYADGSMPSWLESLTRPLDPVVWALGTIVAGYVVVGIIWGVQARRSTVGPDDQAQKTATGPPP